MNAGLTTGALLVLSGTLMYSYATSRAKRTSPNAPKANGVHAGDPRKKAEMSGVSVALADRPPNGVRKRRPMEGQEDE